MKDSSERFPLGDWRKPISQKNILTAAFLLLFALCSLNIFHICHLRTERRMNNARQFAVSEGRKVVYAIESRATTAKVMEMYVMRNNGDVSDFDEVAQVYFTGDSALRSIQLAPDGVVTQALTYPHSEGPAEPHDLFADPARWDAAAYARDTGCILLSGPYDLMQGGRGLPIRDPIYLKNQAGRERFWGFSIVVLRVPEIFDLEQVNLLSDDNYYYRLWRDTPDGTQVLVENTDGVLDDPICEKIELFGAQWHLDLVPQNGWLPVSTLAMLVLVYGTTLFLVMLGLSYYLKIRELVYRDGLLGVGNLNALTRRYELLPRGEAEKLYLMALDVDKFKEFNYIYGADEGDRLLRYLAATIREVAPTTAVYRYAFDYFLLVDSFEDPSECEKEVQAVLQRFRRDIDAGTIPPFEISAGIRKVRPGDSLQLIINDALIAREAIKGNALRHYAFYDAEIRSQRLDYMEMESSLPSALQNGEFHIYYQPKYNMITSEIQGAEALVRWIKPDGTVLSPGAFIPCFEESHQITLLDEYVLREVCRKMCDMAREGLPIKPVSVNLSRVHLQDTGFLPKIERILHEYEIDPAMLSFEITESALVEGSIPLQAIVDHLHSLGCQVDMDDYGVGVSGPKALATYNFDTVKFDKSFVDDIQNPKVADVVRSTIYLVRQWGMQIIVEGIETKEQARLLVSLGCTSAQGYFYSRPVPELDYRDLLRASLWYPMHDERRVSLRPKFFPDEVRAVFDSNLLPLYIINPKSFTVVYSNLAMQKVLGEDATGGLCYRKMRGRTTPCESCSAMRLYRDGDSSPKEFLSPQGRWALIQASPLYWRGREYIQISCMDITRQKQLEEQLRQQTTESSPE